MRSHSNPLGTAGAESLASALEQDMVQLTHLHLGACNLRDAGAYVPLTRR